MKLRLLNEYDFVPGASLSPKRDEQIQFNRHKVSTPQQEIPSDDEYDEEADIQYDDITEVIWHLTEFAGDRITVFDIAETIGFDPDELVDIASNLTSQGLMAHSYIDNGVESIIDQDDLRPLLSHVFGML